MDHLSSRRVMLLVMAASALSACAAPSSHPLDPLGATGAPSGGDIRAEPVPLTERDEPHPSFVLDGGPDKAARSEP